MSDCASQPEQDSALARRIVVALQAGLPLDRHPYRTLAAQLGIGEQLLLDTLAGMQAEGLIRRIGVVPNHYALGYRYNLMVVWDVADEQVATLGARLGAEEFVSHCYRRPRREGWRYNLFTMVHGRSEDEVEAKVATLQALLGSACRDHTALNSTRILKKTGLRLRRTEE